MRERERPFTPRLRRTVVDASSSSVARAAGDGGTPLDGDDDAGTSSLPLSTPRRGFLGGQSRARASRARVFGGKTRLGRRSDGRLVRRGDAEAKRGEATWRAATQVETDRRRAAAFYGLRAQREGRVGRVKHGTRYCRLVQRVPPLLT